jgi:dipeptidyl aminopeptidase/acylaminoacyl peptidase
MSISADQPERANELEHQLLFRELDARRQNGFGQLEFPIGKPLYKTPGWIGDVRVSPRGDGIAFIDHPVPADDGGSVMIVDLEGNHKTLSSGWVSADGLAWSPTGEEIWFTATKSGIARAIQAVSLSGKGRLIARVPAELTLLDIARDRRVLLKRETGRAEMKGHIDGDSQERELSWFDATLPADLSRDGRTLLFGEYGEAGGANYAVYVRGTDGSPAVRLGERAAQALSPDGNWALCVTRTSPGQIIMLPTKAGEPRTITHDSVDHVSASWHPDGKRLVFAGSEPGHAIRLWIQDVEGGKPKPISPEGGALFAVYVSPDGKEVIGLGPDGKTYLSPVDGGEPRIVPGLEPNDRTGGFSADGASICVHNMAGLPTVGSLVNIATGKRKVWKQIVPADAAGVDNVGNILFTPDMKSYVYSYTRTLSDLYLVEGLK